MIAVCQVVRKPIDCPGPDAGMPRADWLCPVGNMLPTRHGAGFERLASDAENCYPSRRLWRHRRKSVPMSSEAAASRVSGFESDAGVSAMLRFAVRTGAMLLLVSALATLTTSAGAQNRPPQGRAAPAGRAIGPMVHPAAPFARFVAPAPRFMPHIVMPRGPVGPP